MRFASCSVSVAALLLAGCVTTGTEMKMGDSSAKTVATGSAGGATSTNANAQLERCDATLGTLAVVEDQTAPWFYQLSNYKLTSTVPVIRLLVQQSNCFVVVERGRAMNNMMQERALQQSGELRSNSSMGPGQMVAADYTMNPSITFSQNDAGGVGAALGGFGRGLGLLGAVAGSLKFKEASTMLTLVDNRSGVQLAAAEGSSSKTDFGAWGGVFGSAAGGGLGGYTNTAEGKVITAAFADAYNQLVKSVKNYKAQEVKGGLGTGGRLGVSGGSTPASRELDAKAAPAAAPASSSTPTAAPVSNTPATKSAPASSTSKPATTQRRTTRPSTAKPASTAK
ncbi:MAG: peptidoglycan-binding protein [Burkholderiales bacterium]|nr:peptidoglycan-binding protein [Burkholderiales bacterium]